MEKEKDQNRNIQINIDIDFTTIAFFCLVGFIIYVVWR